jgi:hypothetical protein
MDDLDVCRGCCHGGCCFAAKAAVLDTLRAVEPEILLRRAVEAYIEAEDHPVMDERDEALAEVGLMLQHVVMKQLTDVCEFDPRYVTLDGLKPLSEHSDGACELDVLGAFNMLDGSRSDAARRGPPQREAGRGVRSEARRGRQHVRDANERASVHAPHGQRTLGAPPEPALSVKALPL